jgi:GTP-binding protein
MQEQTDKAIEDADIIFFMIDARIPCTPYDFELAQKLRRIQKPVFILSNKAEGNHIFPGTVDAHSLGVGPIINISAEHGDGLDELYSELLSCLKKKGLLEDDFFKHEKEEIEEDKPVKITIMGRPNVGKSTLANALLGEDRLLTGDLPGLTRDSIRIPFTYNDRKIELIDTAGLRRAGKIHESLEHLSANDAKKALQYSEIVILVIDCTQAFEKQDLSIAYDIYNEGRAMVIALNKWDKVKDKTAFLHAIEVKLETQFAQAKGIPFIGISALKKVNLDMLMDAVFRVYALWNKRISTAKLNDWLQEATAIHPPPAVAGRRIRLKYMTQVKTRPPTFVVFCTKADELPESYTRYLINGLRTVFKLPGIPMRVSLKKTKNPYEK